MTNTAKKQTASVAKSAPDEQPARREARIMDVARLLKCRYQKARDLMLSGAFGETRKDANGKLVVFEADVLAFDERRKAP